MWELSVWIRALAKHYYHDDPPPPALLSFYTKSVCVFPDFLSPLASPIAFLSHLFSYIRALFLSCPAWRVSAHSEEPDEYKTSSTSASITTHACAFLWEANSACHSWPHSSGMRWGDSVNDTHTLLSRNAYACVYLQLNRFPKYTTDKLRDITRYPLCKPVNCCLIRLNT